MVIEEQEIESHFFGWELRNSSSVFGINYFVLFRWEAKKIMKILEEYMKYKRFDDKYYYSYEVRFPSYGFWVINFNFLGVKLCLCVVILTLLKCLRRVCDDDDESVTGSHLWFRFKVFPKSFPYSKKNNISFDFLNSIVSTFLRATWKNCD